MKVEFFDEWANHGGPLLAMFAEQFTGLGSELPSPRGIAREPGQLDLRPDELGASVVAVVFQPVGIDQARGIVLWLFADVRKKVVFFGHVREASQQNTVFRFFPCLPRCSTISMYSSADGTLQSVSPTSTDTLPIVRAAAFALSTNGMT